MNDKDLRVRRTKKTLREALIRLLRKKEFDKISVIDICREAMITRATFYVHYSDKYELLEDSLKKVLLEPLEEYRVKEHKIETTEEMFTLCEEVISNIASQRGAIADILKRNEYVSFYVRRYLSGILSKIVSGRAAPSVPKEIYSAYYSDACVGVISLWVRDNLPYTESEIVGFLKSLLFREQPCAN